jgi:hypothetical protein
MTRDPGILPRPVLLLACAAIAAAGLCLAPAAPLGCGPQALPDVRASCAERGR